MIANPKALLYYDRFEDSVEKHDCLYCENPDCTRDDTCEPPEHIQWEDVECYDLCHLNFTTEMYDDILAIKEDTEFHDDERQHFLQHRAGADYAQESSSSEQTQPKYDSDNGADGDDI